MNAEEQQHWDNWNLKMSATGLTDERRPYIDEALAEFNKLGLPRGASVLDVGIGAGWTTGALYQRYRYVGLDLGEKSIAEAKKRYPDADLTAIDFLEWAEPQAAFDAVLCVDTIMCMPRQDEAIRKMRRALKPGGALVITGVNPFVYSRLKWVGPPAEGQNRTWLSRVELHRVLEQNGFRVESSRTILPSGDQGWLRLVNGRRLNKLLGDPYQRAKEAVGLGQFRLVTARSA